MTKISNRISINQTKIIWILCATAFLIIIASVVGQLIKYIYGHPRVYGLVNLFYLDEENNIPTAFSTLMLIFAGVLLAVIAFLWDKQKINHRSKWTVLSLGFIYMAYDEAFEVHELFGKSFKTLFTDGNFGFFYFIWVIPGILIVFILGLFFFRFILQLPSKTRLTFIISAVLYIGGSIGIELIGGKYAEINGFESLSYSMIATLEESLEIAGLILFNWGLLNYLAVNNKEILITFKNR